MAAFQSTLTDFSSAYRPATGLYFGAPIWQLTASSSGTGSSSSVSLKIVYKQASGSASGSASSAGVRAVPRSASGSAVGSYTIVISGPTESRLSSVSDFSFPFLNGGRFYLGARQFYRTATASGSSSESSAFIRGLVRSASGSGSAGASTSTDKEILFRSATGSATSSGEADPYLFVVRQGVGSGSGSSSAQFKRGHLRPATGSGLGTSSASKKLVAKRNASGSGTGTSTSRRHVLNTRTASASGVGTSSSTSKESLPRYASGSGVGSTSGQVIWTKSRIFRVPTTTGFAWAELSNRPADRLFSHVPLGVRVENLWRLPNGTYTINNPGYGAATREYLGGHNIFLTDEEVSELTAAGYGAYIS